jgi:phosphatidylglycerophosphatase A
MNPEEEQQSVAQKKIEKLLQSAEVARKNKRIEHGLTGLLSGNIALLKNDELVKFLSGHLSEIIKDNKYDCLNALLIILGKASLSSDERIRERAVVILALTSKSLLEDADAEESILLFSRILVEWLKSEDEFIEGYEIICQLLERIGVILIRNCNWYEADHILKALYEIESGIYTKKASMRSVVSRAQRNIARQEILEFIYSFYLKEPNETAGELNRLLLHLGRYSVIHALSILRQSESVTGKEHLVRFLVQGGNLSAQIMHEYMRDDDPWFLICDIIKIWCQMGDDRFYPYIEEGLKFQDQRVQNEVLMCIFRSGGPEKTERLIRAIKHVVNPLKVAIIKELTRKSTDGVREVLHIMLDDLLVKDATDSVDLLFAIVTGLQKFPDDTSLKYLGRLAAEIKSGRIDRMLQMIVAETRSMLETELRHKAHRRIDDQHGISFTDDPVMKQNTINRTRDIDQQVSKIIADSGVEQASELLFLKSIEYAREKDFEVAERLRDRLFEVNSGAIDKVLEADKIITIERQSRIPVSHLELWKDLKNTLGEQALEDLYDAVEIETYEAGELIAKEGERDDRLYFINTGEISLHCSTGQSDTFLKRFRAGSVLGLEQFFAVSVWTATVKAATSVELYVLCRDSLGELEKKCPGIEKKLHTYCQGAVHVPDLLKISGVDRRNSVRYRMSAKIKIQIFDAYGKAGQRPFVSLLQDISQGGFCFTIGISSKDNARLLLGRKVHADFDVADGVHVKIEGGIVGVLPEKSVRGSYRVNVKMFEMLPQAEVKFITNTFKR